ncbi:MAG: hypothetical protein COW65_07685 [Cytophagales bacterium CG18_big_fil_WC_8_21_14_2_50_42_9]|nr:MAG: hypothetical protein COW65_07685 [Cytophagales bacterium CG18_big_fil_WC_8_21_14_2_50_42_9]
MKKTLLLLFYINFLLPFALLAQIKNEGIPFIKNFTQKDYKGSPQNWAVVQDQRGVMYFGNNYGFLEFDGNSWRLQGVANKTIVRSLAVDKNGRIYVGGQSDFGYLVPDAQGQMVFASLKPKIEKPYKNFDDVWKIYITEDGVLFGTQSTIYLLKNDQIKAYSTPAEQGNTPFYINEKILLQIPGKGLYEFRNEKTYLIPNSQAISNYALVGMLPYTDNKILIVTEQKGLFIYDGYSDFKPWITPSEDFLKGNKLNAAIAIAEGYALGSTGNGLLIMDKNGYPRQHLNREKGLQNNSVQTIYEDNAGNLWLGLNNGIDYVQVNSPFSLFNAKNGLPGTGYTSLLDQNQLYLGTNEGLYVKPWSNQENPLLSTSFRLVEGSQGQVYNLQKIRNKILLSHHNGAFEIINNKAYRLLEQRGIWKFMVLRQDPDYVLCGSYNGLLLFQFTDDKLVFKRKLAGFNESSRVFEEDEAGNIWVAHGYKGVYKIKLSPTLDKITQLDFYDSRYGFPSNLFINVFRINKHLVFTGETGIYAYNAQQNRFVKHPEFSKLFESNKHIRKLIQDKEGNIWFSVGEGMGVFRKRPNGSYEAEKNTFNRLEGRLVAGFEHIAFYDHQNVFIGIDEGFVHYNPAIRQTQSAEQTFYTLIRQVTITADAQDSLLAGGTFTQNNAFTAQQPASAVPILAYAFNSLKFTFSAVQYHEIDKIQYQYFLEGFDKNWSNWTAMTQKEYTNLKEGDYIFHVRAKDIYNKQSTEDTYKFTILPPWYRSSYAYIFYFLMSLFGLWWLRKFILHREEKARRWSEKEQEKALRLQEAQHTEAVLKAEKEIIKLNNEKLEHEINNKNKELATSAMHVMHNLETMQKLRGQLQEVIGDVQDKETMLQLKKLLKSVDEDIKFENNWEQFELHFNQIHQDFLKRLANDFPQLTHRDIKLCAYLRLNLSTKEIASLLNLSLRGIEASRYRLRKKMDMDPEANLTDFILKY